jgi:hypothetical protein
MYSSFVGQNGSKKESKNYDAANPPLLAPWSDSTSQF